MERIEREQMLAEFGAPGVQNAKVVDLISVDAAADTVVLAMFESRPWGIGPEQFGQIEEKINRYMGYALDGFLVEHYPAYHGKQVRIRLDCVEEPTGEAARFVDAARQAIVAHGLEFQVVVGPTPA
jgi:hypothetical protein